MGASVGIFDKRVAFKPFEYPEVTKYKDAINHSYWLVSEWNFTSDVQDFHVHLDDVQRSAIKNALLAISQIEVSVKRFWTKIGDRFPKAEIEQVGITFGESEVRHSDSYSHLLQILGLNEQFEQILNNPVIQGRVDYLTKYLKGAADDSQQNYALSLTLFSIFIENVSLFSQFAVIKSFNKHYNYLKDIDNVVQATAREETLHALFGVELLKIIRRENPEWFDEEFNLKLQRACKKAYEAESAIIDWIFEAGELEKLSKATLKEFVKHRFNESLAMLDVDPVFEVEQGAVREMEWFTAEIYAQVDTDFFHKRPVSYSKMTQSFTAEDLF